MFGSAFSAKTASTRRVAPSRLNVNVLNGKIAGAAIVNHAEQPAQFFALDADVDEIGYLSAGGLVRDDIAGFIHDLKIGNSRWQGKFRSHDIGSRHG